MKFKQFLIIILVLILAGNLKAKFSDGKYSGDFISYSIDARSFALGNFNLTSFNDASSVYWNPAALAFERSDKNLLLSHSERFGGLLNQEFIAFTKKLKNDYYTGIGLIRVGVDDIKLTKLQNEGELSAENRPIIDRMVNDNEFALFLSLAKNYNEKLSLGINTKILGKFVEVESAYGIGFDLAALYSYNEHFKFAAKVQDITTSVLSWSTGLNEFIKPSLLTAAEYSSYINYLSSDLNIYFGTKLQTEGYSEHAFASFGGIFDLTTHTGLELFIKEIVYLRGGLENLDKWSVGSGISLYGFRVDYGFKPDYEDLGNSHKVSLNYTWK